MQGLNEPAQKASAMAEVLLNDGDQLRPEQGQQSQRPQIAPRDVIQAVVHPVDHRGLTRPHPELTRIGDAADFALQGVELEGETERAREIGESPPSRLEQLGGGPEPGYPHGPDLPRPGGQDVEQSRPLEPLHYVQIDDVDAIHAVQRLEDRLVRGEVGEFHQGADRVVGLERVEDPVRLGQG
ncbi:hypothetical protein TorRG33x02_239880 [Trema orientale]|uniref:Uncharacterized protein n=1 Tax=Trema orientale TaxID=63057 RepID=A0A2P5DWG5_TREOI|nr:hypothetical protein TorRG33x02_239880 [Trema orientale]